MATTQRMTLIAAILGSVVVFVDSTVVNVALPAIADDLGVGLAGQQWIVAAYLLTLVSLLLVGGSLGDRYGRRRVFMIGLVCFALTSVLCAAASSEQLLVGARALQGVSGALLVPGSLALIAAAFPGTARGGAVGLWTAWTGIALLIGPLIGGALVEALSWRWIFWISLPMIAVTLVLAHRFIEESRDEQAHGSVDLLGIALSCLGLAGPVFALIEQPTHGWGDPIVWVPMTAGLTLFAAFIWHEARTSAPMLDLSLFRIRVFSVANVVTLVVYAGLVGGLLFVGLFLQQVAGYSPIEAGLATTPVVLVAFALSPPFGRLASRIGPRIPLSVGPVIGGLGMFLMLRIDSEAPYVSQVLPAMLVFGFGLSVTIAPLTAAVLDSVEARQVGVASGVNNCIARAAGLLAIAVLGAVIGATFSARLDDELLPNGGLTARALAVAEDAREQPLGGPPSIEKLTDRQAVVVGAAIEDASTHAFHVGIGIGGVLMVVGGLIAAVGLRSRQMTDADELPSAASAADNGHQLEPG